MINNFYCDVILFLIIDKKFKILKTKLELKTLKIIDYKR